MRIILPKIWDDVKVIGKLEGYKHYGLRKGSVGKLIKIEGDNFLVFFPNKAQRELSFYPTEIRSIKGKKWNKEERERIERLKAIRAYWGGVR